jgi:uncharacterized protein (UPF0210 family)
MDIRIIAKVISVLPIDMVAGRTENFRRVNYIIETLSKNKPVKLCISVWNEDIEQFDIQIGDIIRATTAIRSTPGEHHWHTYLNTYKLTKITSMVKNRDSIHNTNTKT